MLIISLVLLLVILVLTIRQGILTRDRNMYFDRLMEQFKLYEALEEGLTEQEENYEQQFISFQEKIDTQQNSIEYLRDVVNDLEEETMFHRENCLPQLLPMNGEDG